MVLAIILVTVTYLLPVAVAISLDADNVRSWTDGHFVAVASEQAIMRCHQIVITSSSRV